MRGGWTNTSAGLSLANSLLSTALTDYYELGSRRLFEIEEAEEKGESDGVEGYGAVEVVTARDVGWMFADVVAFLNYYEELQAEPFVSGAWGKIYLRSSTEGARIGKGEPCYQRV